MSDVIFLMIAISFLMMAFLTAVRPFRRRRAASAEFRGPATSSPIRQCFAG